MKIIDVFCGKCGDRCQVADTDPKEYDITDAQSDAAVLAGLDTYAMATEREEQIVDAIYARLHAFYVGGQDDKR